MISFKDFVVYKEQDVSTKDWKKEYISLERGFIPPSKMRPIINAFAKSGDISIIKDTSKDVTMPKKSLFLTGGSVRDFLKDKSVKQFHLVTPATPEQVAHILHASGFRMDEDRSNKKGENLKLTFAPKVANPKDPKKWFILDRDKKGAIIAIGAEIKEEEFEIATFRKNAKTNNSSDGADFVDNPVDDASGRDLNMNALYLDLSKPDGENNKLYDPTGKGLHDIRNGSVRTVGKAEDRFKEDPSRVLRAIRFHCRFGKGSKLDTDIERSLPRFKELEGVDEEKVTSEFLSGLLHPDTNVKCYIDIFKRTGILNKLFSGVEINTDIPPQFLEKRDKPLAIAWLLKDNPIEAVEQMLVPTKGWSGQDKKAVLFLLRLLEFHPESRPEMLRQWKGTGLSKNQIRDWVDMFKFTDTQGRVRNRRPTWANSVLIFADNDKPLASWNDMEKQNMHLCSQCGGLGKMNMGMNMGMGLGRCNHCSGSGELPEFERNGLLDKLEIQKFLQAIGKMIDF